MGKNNVVNILFNFDDILVFSVDGINANSVENDTKFCHDVFGDAARDFVDISNG